MKLNRCGKAEPFSETLVLQLMQEMPPPHRYILGMTWYCCERVGAICRLRRTDCYCGDRPLKTIVIGRSIRKDRTTKEVPVTPRLKRLLLEIKPTSSEWLFPAPRDPEKPISTDTYRRALARACKRLGLIGYSTHSARRGAITTLARKGISVAVIQRLSGHRSLSGINAYLNTDQIEVDAAARLL